MAVILVYLKNCLFFEKFLLAVLRKCCYNVCLKSTLKFQKDMKKTTLLATAFATVAIAGVVQFSSNATIACPFSKKSIPSQSSLNGSTNPWGSFLSKISPLKSDNAGIWTAAGTAGLFALGALYLSVRHSEDTAAPVDAMEELKEHPEAPGGELDLPFEEVKSEESEVAVDAQSEKEIALV